jgi:hypothetical protein
MSTGGRSDYELGQRLATDGDLPAAEAAFRRADEAGHSAAAAYVGLFAEARRDTGAARAAYARADKRGDGLGAFRLGLLLAAGGDWESARAAWARAEQRGPADVPPELEARLFPDTRAPAGGSGVAPIASPIMIGAVTVLLAVIAVFLAYIANTGLPFVPSTQLRVEVSDGANIVVGNDVREGGFWIGLVSAMKPLRLANGTTVAVLTLKIDKAYSKIPVDSTANDRLPVGPRPQIPRHHEGHLAASDPGRGHAAGPSDERAGAVGSDLWGVHGADAGGDREWSGVEWGHPGGAGVGAERHDRGAAAAAGASGARRAVPVGSEHPVDAVHQWSGLVHGGGGAGGADAGEVVRGYGDDVSCHQCASG